MAMIFSRSKFTNRSRYVSHRASFCINLIDIKLKESKYFACINNKNLFVTPLIVKELGSSEAQLMMRVSWVAQGENKNSGGLYIFNDYSDVVNLIFYSSMNIFLP